MGVKETINRANLTAIDFTTNVFFFVPFANVAA